MSTAEPPAWDVIDARAREVKVRILRRRMSVSCYTTTAIVSRMFDLSIGDLDDKDADIVLRAMCDAALERLRGMLG